MALKKPGRIRMEIGRREFIGASALILLCALALSLNSQNITLTTSYPAPSGVYAQIITTGGDPANPQDTILARDRGKVLLSPNAAGNVGVATNAPGSQLDVNGTAQLRGSAGGTGLYVNANGVGIGTTAPGVPLDVNGSLAVRDGTQALGKVLVSDANGVASWKTFTTWNGRKLANPNASITCPAGMLVTGCWDWESPGGDFVCNTAVSAGGTTCSTGGCIVPPGQNGYMLMAICAGLQ